LFERWVKLIYSGKNDVIKHLWQANFQEYARISRTVSFGSRTVSIDQEQNDPDQEGYNQII